MKKRNNDMKRHCRDIKKIIWMKWRLLTSTKGAIKAVAKTAPKAPKSGYHLFLREQLDEMT